MLLYRSYPECSQLLQPYLTECGIGKGAVRILSGDPTSQKRRKLTTAETLVQDARIFTKRDSTVLRSFTELAEEAGQHFASRGVVNRLLIGDWTYLAYGKFGTAMKVERYIDQRYMHEPTHSTVVCCYREKGFSSLPLTEITELFDMHDEIILPGTRFVR